MKENQKGAKGRVLSNKMDKTIVVELKTSVLHPKYKKYMLRTRKIKAHDEHNVAQIGDVVRLVETRPLSKDKRWELLIPTDKSKV